MRSSSRLGFLDAFLLFGALLLLGAARLVFLALLFLFGALLLGLRPLLFLGFLALLFFESALFQLRLLQFFLALGFRFFLFLALRRFLFLLLRSFSFSSISAAEGCFGASTFGSAGRRGRL